ncbi:MAG: hypothetical protein CME69_07630 [Halobacteriovorax sp.]|nr:hypothetical protein [Halobacteriovorax sp.]|tara:strand:+ start:498 stop:1877 length:1380 start_codon:yes stop_codon:yes gene_type:complete
MLKTKEKVLAYIYRMNGTMREVLVFDHPNAPEVNPQVPAGTLNNKEEPLEGVLREVKEESGLQIESKHTYHGQFDYHAKSRNEIHKRHVFSFMCEGLSDSWSHQVNSNDEDHNELFYYYWLPVEEAKKKLVNEQGRYLPLVNGHFIDSFDILNKDVTEFLKVGGLHANLSRYFSLKRIAAHYFKIPTGYRTSEPHAESHEEEFVYVISGQIDLWLNGHIKKMSAGDCIGFPAGTGVGHCFINNSGVDCELFVSGDRTKSENKYHFHLDQSLKEECGDKWWDNMPIQDLGGHDGLPGEYHDSFLSDEIEVLNGPSNITEDTFSYPGDDETFSNGLCLSRHYNMKSVAIWLERIPPGKRTSWDHAHSFEEEFVFILKGNPIVRLNGENHRARPFYGIDFKAGSGVAHTLINDSTEDIYYLCVGECEAKEDRIFYPNQRERNLEMREKGVLWEEMFDQDKNS